MQAAERMLSAHIDHCPHAPVKLCAEGSALSTAAFFSHAQRCDTCCGGSIRSAFGRLKELTREHDAFDRD
jgi:hypothetical protein